MIHYTGVDETAIDFDPPTPSQMLGQIKCAFRAGTLSPETAYILHLLVLHSFREASEADLDKSDKVLMDILLSHYDYIEGPDDDGAEIVTHVSHVPATPITRDGTPVACNA